MDCYRLTTEKQLNVLDLNTIFKSGSLSFPCALYCFTYTAEDISLIEWPERLGNKVPKDRLDVTILDAASSKQTEGRSFLLNSFGSRWNAMLEELTFQYSIPDKHISREADNT
jgi:tRNA A37 threonylcarbamoyladenosine biosynthesis protein TsaE